MLHALPKVRILLLMRHSMVRNGSRRKSLRCKVDGVFRGYRECLDKFVVFGESHLEHICRMYERYYNSVRPHSSLGNEPVGVEKMPPPESVEEKDGVVCDVWLGGCSGTTGRLRRDCSHRGGANSLAASTPAHRPRT